MLVTALAALAITVVGALVVRGIACHLELCGREGARNG